MIGGVGLNPVLVENIVQVLYSGCDTNLKSGTRCESYGRWCLKTCGNIKFQGADFEKWTCDPCRSERLRILEEKMRDPKIEFEELKRTKRRLRSCYY